MALAIAAGWLATVLVVGVVPTPTHAAIPSRIDLFDPSGSRTGFAVVTGDRVDFFDARGNRTGSGRLQDRGRVDFFDPRGKRTGSRIIEGDRIPLFDTRSNRMGLGRIRAGEFETFDRHGTRTRLGR
jgi:hypothetical protein